MPSLIFRHSLLAFLAFLQACALPISTPLVARGTNATLAPPSSYDSEETWWQRNIYILQTTRLVLLICFTVLMHILWTRWRSSKPKLRGSVGDLQRAFDAPSVLDMTEVSDADAPTIDEELEMSAVATVELQLDRGGNDRAGTPCPPPRVHRSPSSKFREPTSIGPVIAPHVVGSQSGTRVTSMTEVGVSDLESIDVFG